MKAFSLGNLHEIHYHTIQLLTSMCGTSANASASASVSAGDTLVLMLVLMRC